MAKRKTCKYCKYWDYRRIFEGYLGRDSFTVMDNVECKSGKWHAKYLDKPTDNADNVLVDYEYGNFYGVYTGENFGCVHWIDAGRETGWLEKERKISKSIKDRYFKAYYDFIQKQRKKGIPV